MLSKSNSLVQTVCLCLSLLTEGSAIEEEDWNELTYVMLTLKCIYKKLTHYVRNKPCQTTLMPKDRMKLMSKASVRYQNIAKKFSCPECNLTVTAFIALWRHMKAKHKLNIASSSARRMYNILTPQYERKKREVTTVISQGHTP